MSSKHQPVYDGGGRRQVRSFVRRKGRMSDTREDAYRRLMPVHGISFRPEQTDPARLFPHPGEVVLEIGFGMGHATLELAINNPGTNYLGIEVHVPGVASVLSKIESLGLNNLKLIEHDAVEVLKYMIPPESFSGVHIFFPDPWPKKRHFKRRLIQQDFLKLLVPRVKLDGYIYMVTDWEDYARWMKEHLDAHPGLENQYGGYADALQWRPSTAFEQKGLNKKHIIRELFYRRTF